MRVRPVLLAPVPLVAFFGLQVALIAQSFAGGGGTKPAVANDARVAGDRERTRFIADLSKKVDVHVFALGNPYRVIVDAPDVSFQMPDGVGKAKRRLVNAYQHGFVA